MLEIQNVSKTFNAGTVNEKTALNGLNLKLNEGDFVTVIGGNGAGKSTMLNAVAGVWPVDEGKILIDGVDVTRLSEHQRAAYIGRVFQDPMTGTAATMQIEENLALAARRGKPRTLRIGITKAEREQYRELLKTLDLGLEDRLTARVGLLSGGQRQALTLLMATLVTPKLLLLDEPTSGLDPVVRDEVLDLLYDFMQDENHAILLSSHITSDLDKIADEITFIHKGEVLLSEPRDELLDTCGILRCTADQLDALDPSAVRAKRVGAFGCEALVRRDGVPANWSVEPVNIEQIMLFLTRGEDAR